MSRNFVSMLENAPLADGDGEFFSGEDEISGVGMQKSSSAKNLRKQKIAPMQRELMWANPLNIFATLL